MWRVGPGGNYSKISNSSKGRPQASGYRHIFSISTNASVDRRGSLRWREFSLIQVPSPSKEEQYAIVDVLQAADLEINQLEKKLEALEKQKRGLMQKLLTGEVRVK
jgi:type I restriction enzyme S subunit